MMMMMMLLWMMPTILTLLILTPIATPPPPPPSSNVYATSTKAAAAAAVVRPPHADNIIHPQSDQEPPLTPASTSDDDDRVESFCLTSFNCDPTDWSDTAYVVDGGAFLGSNGYVQVKPIIISTTTAVTESYKRMKNEMISFLLLDGYTVSVKDGKTMRGGKSFETLQNAWHHRKTMYPVYGSKIPLISPPARQQPWPSPPSQLVGYIKDLNEYRRG
ncbi:hypothetical protein FOZ62_009723, partial [Perkinsus olseni]